MVVCPRCEDEYSYLGVHWSKGCGFPEIPDRKKSILKGVLLGDGYIDTSNKNPRLILVNTNKEYLDYVMESLSWVASSYRVNISAKENAKLKRKSGFDESASEENYSDVYNLYTRSHPYFKNLNQWYDSGEKSFPSELVLDDQCLRHWIACDGNRKDNYLRISANNERNSISKLESIFDRYGMPVKRFDKGERFMNLCFSTKVSKKFWERTKPVPGFEYKWPDKYS